MQIALLVMFAILIFAIIGLEFYSGALHKTCYSIADLSKYTHHVVIMAMKLQVMFGNTLEILALVPGISNSMDVDFPKHRLTAILYSELRTYHSVRGSKNITTSIQR